jgi:putative tryptophan/tyrosine transport system substrate-binding protein
MAIKAKIITISHLEDLIAQGVLLGVCADSYLSGRMAGEKALMVLKGVKPSAIPIETLKEYNIVINKKTLKAGGFQVPSDFMKSVTKFID